jgi:hypothetical protein
MENNERNYLRKTLYFVLVVLAIGLIAEVVYRGYFAYKLHEEVENFKNISTTQPAITSAQKRQVISPKQQTNSLEQDALCALNSDTGKCVCIKRNTGQYVDVSQAECTQRAERATDRLRK